MVIGPPNGVFRVHGLPPELKSDVPFSIVKVLGQPAKRFGVMTVLGRQPRKMENLLLVRYEGNYSNCVVDNISIEKDGLFDVICEPNERSFFIPGSLLFSLIDRALIGVVTSQKGPMQHDVADKVDLTTGQTLFEAYSTNAYLQPPYTPALNRILQRK